MLTIFAFFKICLIFFVDYRRRIFETTPYFFANILCYRTHFAPLFVKVLKAFERYDNISFFGKFFSLFAYELFYFKVFLEIIVAQLFVDFELVVVCFNGFLILFPLLGCNSRRHFSHIFKFLLQFFETIECAIYIIGISCQCLDFVKDFSFLFKVILAFNFLCSKQHCFLFFYNVERFFKLLFEFISLCRKSCLFISVCNKFGFFFFNFIFTDCIELLLQSTHFVTPYVGSLFLRQLG